jgi:hypothetical protein
VRVPDTPSSRRDTGVLAAAVTAVPLLVASGISVIPALGGLWPIAAGVAVLTVVMVVVGMAIVRSARRLLVGQAVDADVVAYTDDRELGILKKGGIPNVSLRVTTIHRIVDSLTCAIPAADRQRALYRCGCDVGESWVRDFKRELPKLEVRRDDLLRQILKWSEYDATAGMGRLTIAVDPDTGEGLVALANSFLSRHRARSVLNWWFAGYLAGSLNVLLGKRVCVELLTADAEACDKTYFRVTATSSPTQATTPVDRRLRVKLSRWLGRLGRPLPRET